MPDRSAVTEVLRRTLRWEMSPARWRSVEVVLLEMGQALTAGDFEGVQGLAEDLEAAGPVRAVSARRAPTSEPGPTPGPIRERISELIHDLAGDPVPHDPDAAAGHAG